MITIIEAIARQEGIEDPQSRCSRNCNPGNIEYGPFTRAHGAIGIENGHTPDRFAVFATLEDGYNCLRSLLKGTVYRGRTIEQMINLYAPSRDNNNVAAYVHNVCVWTGLTPDTIIDDHIG